jgi:hypothetical protein
LEIYIYIYIYILLENRNKIIWQKITRVKLTLPIEKGIFLYFVRLILNQHEVNITAFCKKYNARTTEKMGSLFQLKLQFIKTDVILFFLKIHSASSLLILNRINDKLMINVKLVEKN